MGKEVQNLQNILRPFIEVDRDGDLELDGREQRRFNRLAKEVGLGNIRHISRKISDEFIHRNGKIDLSEYLAWRGETGMAKGVQRYFKNPHYQTALEYSIFKIDHKKEKSREALAGLLSRRIERFAKISCEDGTCKDILTTELKKLGTSYKQRVLISAKIKDPEKRLEFIQGLKQALDLADKEKVMDSLQGALDDPIRSKDRLAKFSPQLKEQAEMLMSLGLSGKESLGYLLDGKAEIDFENFEAKLKAVQSMGLKSRQAAVLILKNENLRSDRLSVRHVKNFARVQKILSFERGQTDIFKTLSRLPVESDPDLILRIVKTARQQFIIDKKFKAKYVLIDCLTQLSPHIRTPLASLEKAMSILDKEFKRVPSRFYNSLLRDMVVCGKKPEVIEEAAQSLHRYFPTEESRKHLTRKLLGKKDWVNFLFFVGYQKEDLKKLEQSMRPEGIGERLLQDALYLKQKHRVHRFFRYKLETVEILKQGQNPKPGQKVVNVFSAYADHNNAFADLHELIQGLHDQGYAVQHRELKRPRAALRWMRFHQEFASREGIVLSGHGHTTGMTFGNYQDSLQKLEANQIDTLREMLSFVKPGGFVILDSCSTGKGEDSLGASMAKMAPQVEVQAHGCDAASKFEFNQARPRMLSLCHDESGNWDNAYQESRIFNVMANRTV